MQLRRKRSVPAPNSPVALVATLACMAAVYAAVPNSHGGAVAGEGDDTLNTVLKGIEHNYDQIHSARGVFLVRYERGTDPIFTQSEGPKPQGTQKYWWAFSGRAFREEVSWLKGDGKQTPPQVVAFDGQQGYYWEMGENIIHVYPAERLARSMVLSTVGRVLGLAYKFEPPVQSLGSVMRERNARVAGREPVDGLDCYRLEAPARDSTEMLSHTWWIAPDRGFCVKKHRWVKKGGDGAQFRLAGWVDVAHELTQFDNGTWLSTAITSTNFVQMPDGTELTGPTQLFSTQELAINVDIDPALFRLQFPLSAEVFGLGDGG